MSKINIKIAFLSLILFSIISLNFFSVASEDVNPKPKLSSTIEYINIDGNITNEEWSKAVHKIKFYLDIDNNPDYGGDINVDGYNYLYLGKDENNTYFALDLCGDQSYNGTGEWLGIWLNTYNRDFDSYKEWHDYLNDGTESLIYNIEENQVWTFLSNEMTDYWFYINDDTEYSPWYGSTEGNYTNLRYQWHGESTDDFNITSEAFGLDHIYWINFSIDINNWAFFPEIRNTLSDITIYLRSKVNTSISEQKMIFWNSDGTLPALDDPQQVKPFNTGTSLIQDQFNYGLGNLTVDHKLQFSLFGNNTDPFKTQINFIHFVFRMNRTNYAGPVNYPYSTINNYQINWSFGASPNCPEDHRMFELLIPKSELELYEDNQDLGITVGGYGTLAFKGTNYWCFSEIDTWIDVEVSEYYLYYNMTPEKEAIIPGYNIYFIIAILGAVALVLMKKREVQN